MSAVPTIARQTDDGLHQAHMLYVPSGTSVPLAVSGVTRLAVGDAAIAGVVIAGKGVLLVNGKSHGHTTLFVWQGSECTTYLIEVTQQSLDEYARAVRDAIDEPLVNVQLGKNAIIVTGQVADTPRFTRVSDVISRFHELADKEHFTVVNAVTIVQPLGELQHQMRATAGLEHVNVDFDGKGNVIVSGKVRDRQTAELALAQAAGVAGAYMAADGKVVDRLQVEKMLQIGVKVYVLEIDDTGLTQLGLELQGANPDPSNPGSFIYGNPNFISLESNPVGINVGPFSRITRLAPTLNLVIQSGHAKMLSEPNLVTSQNKEADFLVGGEIPYVYSTGLGQASVVFKQYGVMLKVTPRILPNGDIETVIAPDISSLDYANAVTLNGFEIPALKESSISTDMITRPGEAVVMGGLLQHVDQRTISRIPILGDLPIIGPLFRSTSYQRQDTDVVFVMTPEAIVR